MLFNIFDTIRNTKNYLQSSSGTNNSLSETTSKRLGCVPPHRPGLDKWAKTHTGSRSTGRQSYLYLSLDSTVKARGLMIAVRVYECSKPLCWNEKPATTTDLIVL